MMEFFRGYICTIINIGNYLGSGIISIVYSQYIEQFRKLIKSSSGMTSITDILLDSRRGQIQLDIHKS